MKKAKKPVKRAVAVKARKSAKSKTAPAKKRVSRFKNLKYALHQKIVYPLHGVGEINSIEERVFLGKKTVYYIIYLDVPDMTVMMPVTEADERGIRAIVHKKEALKALTVVAKDFQPIQSQSLKKLDTLQHDLNFEDRSVLDKAKTRTQEVHDELLLGLMEGKK